MNTILPSKILIVGGVAGGASAAARARRLSESAQIIMFERGAFVSFANCGLPYHIGNVIPEESKLLLATPKLFKERFNIDVRIESEVISIDRTAKEVEVKEIATGRIYRESYDALILSPGASPIRPPLPGMDLPGIFSLRTIPDSRLIRSWIQTHKAKRAVVIGGGFIGLEMAENLKHLGLDVTIVEMLTQVMPPFDAEMAYPLQEHLKKNGIALALGDGVAGFEKTENGLSVKTKSGASHAADIVILAIGVRPETTLAKNAGLEIGERGGIRTNEHMQTSDSSIWAVGDAVEVKDFVTGQWTLIPLAGPANRQGRIAADHIFGNEHATFRGTQGTAICGLFGLAIASTGASEKTLKRIGDTDYDKIYLHPNHHVGYYPGAKQIKMKVLFRKSDGRILGAQAVGEEGVDRRIDTIAAFIQKGGTVYDLEESELCYSPQFGGAKDPVNFAGMIAVNSLRGLTPVADWNSISHENSIILDVRDEDEFAEGHLTHAVNIPLNSLRERLHELPKEKELLVYCGVGLRAHTAVRILRQNGFLASNLPGGWKTCKDLAGAGMLSAPITT